MGPSLGSVERASLSVHTRSLQTVAPPNIDPQLLQCLASACPEETQAIQNLFYDFSNGEEVLCKTYENAVESELACLVKRCDDLKDSEYCDKDFMEFYAALQSEATGCDIGRFRCGTLSVGSIVAIALASFVLLILMVYAAFIMYTKRKKRNNATENETESGAETDQPQVAKHSQSFPITLN